MQIPHASILQFRTGRDGKRVVVDSDVLDIAKQIRAIGPLDVVWNEYGEYYTIIEHCADGRERLVTTTTELDQRVVDRLMMISHTDYDYKKEMDRMDKEADKAKDHRFNEEIGEHGEKLRHALRKDLQVQSTVYVPRKV